jgi:hypothetical protein
MKKEEILIFDIDGVLSNPTHRIEHAINKDWDKFNELMALDTPHQKMMDVLFLFLKSNYKVFLLTARPIEFKKTTMSWLRGNFCNELLIKEKIKNKGLELIMRPENNIESSEDFKEKEVLKLKEKFEILLAIDDNKNVIKMYRKHEIYALETMSMYKN